MTYLLRIFLYQCILLISVVLSQNTGNYHSLPVGFEQYPCRNNSKTSYNDVMMVFEGSSVTRSSLVTNTALLNDMLEKEFTIDKKSNDAKMVTQLGTVHYNDKVYLTANLSDVKGGSIPSFEAESGSSALIDAIVMAVNEFVGDRHGEKTHRMVIILFAASANKNLPKKAIIKFRENNGIFIVVDVNNYYKNLELSLLVPEQFYISQAENLDWMDKLKSLLLLANCFCAAGDNGPLFFDKEYEIPVGGCSWSSFGQATRKGAESLCKNIGGRLLAPMNKTIERKTDRLINENQLDQPIWIPLFYNETDGNCYWYGTVKADCCPQKDEQYPADDDAYIYYFNGTISFTHKTSTLAYICQLPPCDSEQYCDDTGSEN